MGSDYPDVNDENYSCLDHESLRLEALSLQVSQLQLDFQLNTDQIQHSIKRLACYSSASSSTSSSSSFVSAEGDDELNLARAPHQTPALQDELLEQFGNLEQSLADIASSLSSLSSSLVLAERARESSRAQEQAPPQYVVKHDPVLATLERIEYSVSDLVSLTSSSLSKTPRPVVQKARQGNLDGKEDHQEHRQLQRQLRQQQRQRRSSSSGDLDLRHKRALRHKILLIKKTLFELGLYANHHDGKPALPAASSIMEDDVLIVWCQSNDFPNYKVNLCSLMIRLLEEEETERKRLAHLQRRVHVDGISPHRLHLQGRIDLLKRTLFNLEVQPPEKDTKPPLPADLQTIDDDVFIAWYNSTHRRVAKTHLFRSIRRLQEEEEEERKFLRDAKDRVYNSDDDDDGPNEEAEDVEKSPHRLALQQKIVLVKQALFEWLLRKKHQVSKSDLPPTHHSIDTDVFLVWCLHTDYYRWCRQEVAYPLCRKPVFNTYEEELCCLIETLQARDEGERLYLLEKRGAGGQKQDSS